MVEEFVVPDSLDLTLECPVCLEPFSSEGKNVPRILPCTHTLCEKCIEDILERNTEDSDVFECPQCKEKHTVRHGVTTFPENRYLLPTIRRKNVKLCDEHKRVIDFYCNSPECQKSICGVCLINEHLTHNVLDLKKLREEKYKLLSRNIEFYE